MVSEVPVMVLAEAQATCTGLSSERADVAAVFGVNMVPRHRVGSDIVVAVLVNKGWERSARL